MKLQTVCTSDKAAKTKVSVKEKVSREMSISAQREELRAGRLESEGEMQEKEKETECIKETSCEQNMRG